MSAAEPMLAHLSSTETAVALAASDATSSDLAAITGRDPASVARMGEWAVQGLCRLGPSAVWWRAFRTVLLNAEVGPRTEYRQIWPSPPRQQAALDAACVYRLATLPDVARQETVTITIGQPTGLPGAGAVTRLFVVLARDVAMAARYPEMITGEWAGLLAELTGDATRRLGPDPTPRHGGEATS